jgi:hypothetical protein
MLRTHGRYAYSNITRRPDYSWPGGKPAGRICRGQHRTVQLVSRSQLADTPTRHLRLYRESPGANRARELRAGGLRLTDAPGSGIRNRLQPHINLIALSPIRGDWMAHDTMWTLRRTHLVIFLGRRSGSC